jgi:cation diffusion facilitator CzcD-associated flavoprotein CzcO
MSRDEHTVDVAIIGSGMSGICMASKLRRAGIETFTIYEKADDVGGTWRENRYPGLACDVPAPFYSYTFAPNPDWTSRFAAGPEIHRYLKTVAEREGVLNHVRYRTEIVDASFDGERWQLRAATGEEFEADVVVAATGVLHLPRIPDIPGLGTFAGALFHSARWDTSVPLDGRRIGVIGTGSTGVQLVTELSARAARVTQFQRSAQWVFPLPNWTYSRACRALLRQSRRLNELLYRAHAWSSGYPGNAMIRSGWERTVMQALCRWHLRTISDEGLRARLTPDYKPLCRRLVVSSGYYRAVQRPSVEVTNAAIERIEPAGVVTADGRLHELDVIALATGFDAHAYRRPMQVTGRDGVTVADAWADGPRAHRTVVLPGFPNLFLMMGPNSPIGNTSLVPIAESQAGFAVRWIERIRSGELRHVSPTQQAADDFNAEVRANMGDTIWASGCDSWYIGPDGHPIMWPFTVPEFHAMLASPDDREYDVQRQQPTPIAA